MSSAMSAQHWNTSHLNVPTKKSDQAKPYRRQRSLSHRRYFGCNEKGHNIAVCPKEEASKQVYQK
jgi:hypothetical protein